MRPRYINATSCIAVAAWLVPTAALADGFTQPAGHGQVIVTSIYSNSAKGLNANGDAVDRDDYQKTEIYVAAEYGVTDDLTLIATPSLRFVSIDNADSTSGLGYTELGARYRLYNKGSLSLSLQGTGRIPGARRQDVVAQIGSTNYEIDMRAQAGYGFGNGHFISASGGYRIRYDDPANEWKLDLTLGLRVAPKFIVMAFSSNTFADGKGRRIFAQDFRYHNLFLTGAYDLSDKITVQAGVVGTVAGVNALRERGGTVGIWYKF
ncbi:hypothetical protein BH10PSE13_BH10PSE13_04460 [soil metagenome]